jgi:hypothetical protein
MTESAPAETPQGTEVDAEEVKEMIAEVKSESTPAADIPFEVTLASGQTYKGKNMEEVLGKVVKAQENASAKITQQNQRLSELENSQKAAIPPASDSEFDSTKYYQLWAEGKDGPLRAKQYMDSYDPTHQEFTTAVATSKQNAELNSFKASVGFNPTPEQAHAYATGFANAGLQATAENLELIYWRMYNAGQLETTATPVSPRRKAPADLGGAGAAPAGGVDMDEFSKLPADQQRAVIEKLSNQ